MGRSRRVDSPRLKIIVQKAGTPEVPWLATIHDLDNEAVVHHVRGKTKQEAWVRAVTSYREVLKEHLSAIETISGLEAAKNADPERCFHRCSCSARCMRPRNDHKNVKHLFPHSRGEHP